MIVRGLWDPFLNYFSREKEWDRDRTVYLNDQNEGFIKSSVTKTDNMRITN